MTIPKGASPFTRFSSSRELNEFRVWLSTRYGVGPATAAGSYLNHGAPVFTTIQEDDRTELNQLRKAAYAHLKAVFRSLQRINEDNKKAEPDAARLLRRAGLLTALHYDEIVYRRARWVLARDHDNRSRDKRVMRKTETTTTLAPAGKPEGEQITLTLKDAHMSREEAVRVNMALPPRLRIPSLVPPPAASQGWKEIKSAELEAIGDARKVFGASFTGKLEPGSLLLQPDKRLIGFTIAVDPSAAGTGPSVPEGTMVALNQEGRIVRAEPASPWIAAGEKTASWGWTPWLRSTDGKLVRQAEYDSSTHGMGGSFYTKVLRMRPKDRGYIPMDVLAQEAEAHGWAWSARSGYSTGNAVVNANGMDFYGDTSTRKDGITGAEIMKRWALFDALKKAVTDLLSNEPALSISDFQDLCGRAGWGRWTSNGGPRKGVIATVHIPTGQTAGRQFVGTGVTTHEAYWGIYRAIQKAGML